MKRLILLLILLTIVWIPYVMHRWLTLPYTNAAWESYLLYSSVAITIAIALLNVLLIVFFKSKRNRLRILKALAILLFLLLLFPIVMGVLNAYGGSHAWLDVLALVILYGHLDWLHRVHEGLAVSCRKENL